MMPVFSHRARTLGARPGMFRCDGRLGDWGSLKCSLVGPWGYLDGPWDARGAYDTAFPPRGLLAPKRPNRESLPLNSKWGSRQESSMRDPADLKF